MLSPATIPPSHRRLVEAFLARRSANTKRSYQAGLRDFAGWLGTSPEQAASYLVSSGLADASATVLAYLQALSDSGRSSSTIQTRGNALKALVLTARITGICDYHLQVPLPSARSYRDTAGPGRERVRALLDAAKAQGSAAKAARDVAILRLLYDLALRCGEVASLRLEDFDGSRIWVRAKGSLDRDGLDLPDSTAAAIRAWIPWRGERPGPLFHRLDRALLSEPEHLTVRAIEYLVGGLSAGLGFHARPHGLRHSAITSALDAGHDVRSVHSFGRWHGGLDIVLVYDDNRKGLGRRIAASIAGEL